MKLKTYLTLFIAIIMAGLIVLGNRGLVDNYKIKKTLGSLKKDNIELVNQNSELKCKVNMLRVNTAYIEMIARNELGMVKKGDMVYRFIK